MTQHAALLLVLGLMAVGGCGPTVMKARPHDPVTANAVLIYQDHPKKYEQLATVTVHVDLDRAWDSAGNANRLFEELKEQAGKYGANGVMLQRLPGQANGRFSAGYRGEFYFVPMETRKSIAVAQAIFVHKE